MGSELVIPQKDNKGWFHCEKCGKRLIRRMANGVFVFKFGRNSRDEDVVNIQIFGSVRIQCIRDRCRHINEISFFPGNTVLD